jgi:hypothetical protein
MEGHAMRNATLILVLAGAINAAAATTQVEFVKPESFTDAGRGLPRSTDAEVLKPLSDHLIRRASQRLAQGQKLEVWITDVDLAGDFEPHQRYSSEVRIVRDLYPPRIDLRFRLADASGAVVKEGTRTLRDAGFLLHRSGDSSDALRFEKSMLDRWLEAEFGR